MKYSYMPTEPEECSVIAFESDQRELIFRNQYGELFRFIPNRVMWISIVLSLIVGFILEKVI